MAKSWFDVARDKLGYGHPAQISAATEQISESEDSARNTDDPPSYQSIIQLEAEVPPPAYESEIVSK